MKKIYALFLVSLLISSLIGQTPFKNKCGAIHSGEVPEKMPDHIPSLAASDSTLIIPVVFHVYHQEGAENIAREQILETLRILNEDFNRQNADTLDIPQVFRDVRGKANVEFRLARKDPNGNCTDGINRIISPLTSQYENWQKVDDGVIWDHTRYINIFVMRDILPSPSSGFNFVLSGHANIPPVSTPGSSAAVDFIQMRYDKLGFGTNGNAAAENGHVLTEEAGHFLSLLHTSFTPGCSGDDGVADTPLQDDLNDVACLDYPHISCNNGPHGDNFHNFMDYTACNNMFTAGQVARMRTCLTTNPWRNVMSSAQNLALTGVLDTSSVFDCAKKPKASFGFGSYTRMHRADVPIWFQDASLWSPASRAWTFEGGNPASSTQWNPVVTFPQPGTYWVKLVVTNTHGTDSTEQMVVVRPNYDYAWANPLETFDDQGASERTYKHQLPNGREWALATVDFATGNQAMYLDSCKRWVSSFETGIFHLGSQPAANRKMRFKVAHGIATSGSAMVNSGLRVIAKRPGNNEQIDFYGILTYLTNSFVVHNANVQIPASTLRTATVPANTLFVPNAAQWKTLEYSIPDTVTGDWVFAFHWGAFEDATSFKGLYIDSIAVIGLTSDIENLPVVSEWILSPNPVHDFVLSKLNQHPSQPHTIRLTDAQGKLLLTTVQNDYETKVDLSALPAGIYFITLLSNQEIHTRKLVKQSKM